jgi:hypothetical protein
MHKFFIPLRNFTVDLDRLSNEIFSFWKISENDTNLELKSPSFTTSLKYVDDPILNFSRYAGAAAAADPNLRQNLVDRFRSNLNRARPQTAAGTHNSSTRDGADNDAAKGPYSVKGPNAFLKRMAATIVHPPCTACLKCGKWIITF